MDPAGCRGLAHRGHGGQPDDTSDLVHDDQCDQPHHSGHRAIGAAARVAHGGADDVRDRTPHVDRHRGGALEAHRAAIQQAPEPEQADQDLEALTELTPGP